MSRPAAILGDVGGTRARFARLELDGVVGPILELATADFGDLAGAARAAFGRLGAADAAAIAIAAPVTGDRVELTNAGWQLSIDATRAALGVERLFVINDFEALARSLPALAADDLDPVRAGSAATDAARVVVGPGTGLGVGALIRDGAGWRPLASECGHADLAAGDEREWRVVERLAARHGGHVSNERALSGPGLAELRDVVRELDGAAAEGLTPDRVAALARAGEDAAAVEAARLFSSWLGALAGDLVLTFTARGGVWLGGGALAGLGGAFDRDRFAARFVAKGRLRPFVEPVPVWRIRDSERATLRGAASLLAEEAA